MSDVNANHDHGFNPRLIAGVVAIGVIAFIALWALIALAPQLGSGNDGGGHALSKAAPGYAGIVDLAERAGAEVELRRRVEKIGRTACRASVRQYGYDPVVAGNLKK